MKIKILVALISTLAAWPLSAQLKAGVADDGSDRIVLKLATDGIYQHAYLQALAKNGAYAGTFWAKVNCETVGSQSLEKARSPQVNTETYLARFNLIDLWLGNLCHGKSDVLPNPEEAKAWLLDMVKTKWSENDKAFLTTHEKLLQLYVFGASGARPDYAATVAFMNEEVKTNSRYPALYFSYLYQHGLGVPQDDAQARTWLQRAAEAGSLDAKMLLAQARELGGKDERSDAEAFSSYQDLAKSVEPPVWFRLGLMYLEGRGTAKDPCKANEWLQKAAGHYWNPVPQARKYLDQIRAQKLCPGVVGGSLVAGEKAPILYPCPAKLPALQQSPGQLHYRWPSTGQKEIKNPAEYNDYVTALNMRDPKEKAAAMEAFVTRYPLSVVKTDALEQAMSAYQQSGDRAKLEDTANRLLELNPDDLRAFGVIVFLARGCYPSQSKLSADETWKALFQLGQQGLVALAELPETIGPSPAENAKLRSTMTVIFAGAAGYGALQTKNYSDARKFYIKAVEAGSKNLQDIYQLGIADLEMDPIDPNGFWYCAKAVSMALPNDRAAQTTSAQIISAYCKMKLRKHGGNPDEWDRFVALAEKDPSPSFNFVENLALRKTSAGNVRGANDPANSPIGVIPTSASGEGDPISKLLLADNVTWGGGIGSGPSTNSTGPARTSPPALLSAPQPEYPKSGRDANIEGLVKLKITVTVEGNAEDIQVIESLGHDFDEQAIAAVKQWKFKPATTKEGKPIAVKAVIEVNFKLRS